MQDYVGYRIRKRRKKERKKKRIIRFLVAAAIAGIFILVLGGAFGLYPFDSATTKVGDAFKWIGRSIGSVFSQGRKTYRYPFLEEGKKTANYLLAVTKLVDGRILLSNLVLISYDSREKEAALIHFPLDLKVDVPGSGEEILRDVVETDGGKMGMCLLVVSNLMGVDVDRYVLCSDRDIRKALEELKVKYEITVSRRVKIDDESLGTKVNISPGRQEMSAGRLAAFLTFSEKGKEMDLLERQKNFFPVFLDISRAESVCGNELRIVERLSERIETDASNRKLAGFWQELSSLKKEKVSQATLPVKRYAVDDQTIYVIDRKKLEGFRNTYLKTEYRYEKRIRIEILNGCGGSAIGQDVVSRIDPAVFQVAKSGNADNFDYQETLIRIYSQDKLIVEKARHLRKVIGVGRVELAPETQDVVDISVIVGKDYLERWKR